MSLQHKKHFLHISFLWCLGGKWEVEYTKYENIVDRAEKISKLWKKNGQEKNFEIHFRKVPITLQPALRYKV